MEEKATRMHFINSAGAPNLVVAGSMEKENDCPLLQIVKLKSRGWSQSFRGCSVRKPKQDICPCVCKPLSWPQSSRCWKTAASVICLSFTGGLEVVVEHGRQVDENWSQGGFRPRQHTDWSEAPGLLDRSTDELMDGRWVCWNRWVSWTVIKEVEEDEHSVLSSFPHLLVRPTWDVSFFQLPLLYILSPEDTPVLSRFQPSLLSPLTSRREAFWKSRHPSRRSADIIFRVTGRKDGGERRWRGNKAEKQKSPKARRWKE